MLHAVIPIRHFDRVSLHKRGFSRRNWLGVVVHLDQHQSTASELFFRKNGARRCTGVGASALTLCGGVAGARVIDDAVNIWVTLEMDREGGGGDCYP